MTAAVSQELPPTPVASRVRTARLGVLGLFWLMGVLLSTFLSRVPSITDALQVTTGRFALLMLTGALGAFVALLGTGWTVAKFGTRKVLWVSTIAYLFAFLGAAWAISAGSQWGFAAGQFFISFTFAFANVAINAEAANVERWVARPIMPHFHASFSIGMAIGLAFGALVSHAGVAPGVHFATVAIAATIARLVLIRPSIVYGEAAGGVRGGIGGPFKTARDEYRDRRVIMIGLIVFAASTIEGSAATWSSLAIVDSFETSESVGDIFYWIFLVAMVTTRGFGAQIIGRLGRVVSLRVSAVLVAIGVIMFAFGPAFAMVGVGMILWGLGAGLGVPIGFSAASDDPRRAAARVAAVSSFATIAGLVMPQVIGHLGEVVELRKALTVVSGAAVLSFLIARAVRAEGPLLRSHRAIARRASMAQTANTDSISIVVVDGVEPVQAAPEDLARRGDTLKP